LWGNRGKFNVEAVSAGIQQRRLKCWNYSSVNETKKCRFFVQLLQQRCEQIDDVAVEHEQ